MTDEVTPELIERLKSRDERVAALDQALAIDTELRSSPIIRVLLEEAAKEKAAALDDLAEVSPSDTRKIIDLQAKVYFAKFIERVLMDRLRRGYVAEQSLHEEPVEADDNTGELDG
jgi:hypothetical protein